MAKLPFTLEEYAARYQAALSTMASNDADVLVVLDESSMVYLTGYEGYSAYVPQIMIVAASEASPILLLREMDVQCAIATTYLGPSAIGFYEESTINIAMTEVWARLGQLVKQRVGSRRLAIEQSSRSLGVRDYAALLGGLGLEETIDGTGWMSSIRRVKSDRELQYMSEAAAIVDAALLEGISAIRVGVRECDVGAAIMHRVCAGTREIPGGAPGFTVAMPAGPIANAPHLKWTDGCYASGCQINFEVGAYRRRYCAALSRTAYIGEPPKRLQQIDHIIRECFEVTLPSLRAGNTCAAVDGVFRKAFNPHGIRKSSRIGYGIGIDWSDGTYTLQSGSNEQLRANSTIHLIIGVWEQNEGYVFSETVKVTDGGGVSLSSMPRKLFQVAP